MFTIDDKHFRLFEVILAPRKTGKSADSIRLETNELITERSLAIDRLPDTIIQ